MRVALMPVMPAEFALHAAFVPRDVAASVVLLPV
jgi:hypothetical protein